MNAKENVAVLFVCMGNICRSPTAEIVFRRVVDEAGLAHAIRIDSAGTHGYHVGDAPDARARLAARRRGYDMTDLRARQVEAGDFERYDHVLAMDRENLALLRRICPPAHAHKLRLFLEFGSHADAHDVPDPYHGGPDGFETVLDLVEDAAVGLLRHLRERHGAG